MAALEQLQIVHQKTAATLEQHGTRLTATEGGLKNVEATVSELQATHAERARMLELQLVQQQRAGELKLRWKDWQWQTQLMRDQLPLAARTRIVQLSRQPNGAAPPSPRRRDLTPVAIKKRMAEQLQQMLDDIWVMGNVVAVRVRVGVEARQAITAAAEAVSDQLEVRPYLSPPRR
jgi:hypothetical protein